MLIFTTAARDLISQAFDAYGNAEDRRIWSRWSAQHRKVRRGPNDAWEDGQPPDAEFASAAARVLWELFSATKDRANSPMSEDELEDLDYELSRIKSVMASLRASPPARAA